jgi:mannose-1-phosphate guanylyltransferase
MFADSVRPWSIVLAGGEGERLKPFVAERFGSPIPKQYCAFVGTRSMLEHALDRAAVLSGTDRVVAVFAENRASLAEPQIAGRGVRALYQPSNRDTLPGLLLPLAAIKARDPKAVVVVHSSDHFVFPESRFIETTRSAARAAETLGDRVVLVGAEPTEAESDYGWISPAHELPLSEPRPVRAVYGFVEKPNVELAATLAGLGALWNTFVFAAKVDVLWDLCRARAPEIVGRFDALLPKLGGRDERAAIAAAYADMPTSNFSTDVLQASRGSLAVVELTDVVWSDFGRAERILETLDRVGFRPSFQKHPALAVAS